MPVVLLPLLFLVAGLGGIWYYRTIPTKEELRRRLPNRVTGAGFVLLAIIVLGIWLIVRYSPSPFLKIAGSTTLLFYLLTFETFLLLFFRWIQSNVACVLLAAAGTVLPFIIQYVHPTYVLSNTLIIIATLGATAMVIRLEVLRSRVILLMTGLFAINDVINVTFFLPKLPLTPPAEQAYPLLIFPTVNIAGHVVGSGDFMFLALTTLILVKTFTPRIAAWHVVIQTLALGVTLAIILHRDVLLPYLVVMSPIFFALYIYAHKHTSALKLVPSETHLQNSQDTTLRS